MKKFWGFIKKHKKLFIFLLIVIIAAVAVFVVMKQKKKKEMEMMDNIMQETFVLEKRDLMNSVSGTGKIVSFDKVELTVPDMTNSLVETLSVAVGDSLNAGDLICTFDTEDLERNLEYAKQDLAIAKKKNANSMDNTSRGLYQTQLGAVNSTNRNLEALDKANREYNTAAGEKAEAKRIYDEIYGVYQDYYDEGKYYDMQKELEKVKKELEEYDKLEEYGNKTVSTASDASEFNAKKEELIVFINNNADINGDNKIDDNTEVNSLKDLSVNPKLSGLTPGDLPGDILNKAYANSDDATIDSYISTYVNNFGYTKGLTSDEFIYKSIRSLFGDLLKANNEYVNAAKETAENIERYNYLKESESELTSRISNMSNAKSNLNTAKSGVDSAQSKLNTAGDTLQTAERTQQDKYLSDVNTVKDAENNYENAKLDSSVVGRTEEDNIRKYEKQLESATVTSPITGVVTAVNVKEGDKYAGTALVTIEDVSKYVIEANIDEYDISKIRVGQQVKFKTRATGDEELEAEVIEVAIKANTTPTGTGTTASTSSSSSVATYKVKMLVKSANDALRLDMSANINIITDQATDVFAIPFNALQEDEEGKNYIEIEDGQMIYVTVGLETDYYVEIKSDDITDGMVIVIPDAAGGSLDDLMVEFGPLGGI